VKIALITDGIWPYVLGGMQKHSYYLCKYLAQQKIQVDLVHFNKSSYNIHQLEFFTEQEKKYIHSIVVDFPSNFKFPGHYLYYSYKHSQLIFHQLKDKLHEYHFIYTKGFTGWYLIQQKKSLSLKANIGVNFHGFEMFQPAPDFISKIQYSLLLRKPVKYICHHADKVFSYGGKITGIIKKIGVNPNNIIEIASGIEASEITEKISENNKPLRFLYLGRYEKRKGISELQQAIMELSTERDDFEFHFIGPIPDEKKINAPFIIYHNEIRDKNTLINQIRQCDILVCPSYSEGFPNVILEAMAQGLTVIATPVGAVELLVTENTGFLIPNNHPQTLKTEMNRILDNPEIVTNKRAQSLSYINTRFTWEKLIIELMNKIK